MELREYLAEAVLNNEAARRVMEMKDSAERLEKLSGHDVDICHRILEIMAPFAENRSMADKWLKSLAQTLTDRMFPDTNHPSVALNEFQIFYLDVLEIVLKQNIDSFDPLVDVLQISEEDIEQSRVAKSYRHFCREVQNAHVTALMMISKETQTFDAASHTIGVHNMATHMAIMAKKAGFQVDIPMVDAASFGHDIGKFGCRGQDAQRVPYLHYYYTWEWFSEHDMEDIGYISANHSTWDLEFENLPIESLLLIYADFRVRGTTEPGKKEVMAIYSLADSYSMILSKLANVTPEKKKRYQTVYCKLRDFEEMLCYNGVSVDIYQNELNAVEKKDASLMNAEETLQSLRRSALKGSTKLMTMVSTDQSFELLLEQAKSEKNPQRIRTYLELLEEFNTYMSKENKKKTLRLLYELLMHQDSEIRHEAGVIMGLILANSGPKYRKERPLGAHKDAETPAMMALLDESIELWEKYIELCIHPDMKHSVTHAMRISNSLKTICNSLFDACSEKEAESMLRPLLKRFYSAVGREEYILVDAFCLVPCSIIPQSEIGHVLDIIGGFLTRSDVNLTLASLKLISNIREEYPETIEKIERIVTPLQIPDGENAIALLKRKNDALGLPMPKLTEDQIAQIYLSDAKNAVHWTVKMAQIEVLTDQVEMSPETCFHTAMHLSNMMSVSEHLPVRQHAGKRLLQIAKGLTVDQINEIAIDLNREQETGQESIVRLIPPCLGGLMHRLPAKEHEETIDALENLIRTSTTSAANSALATIGEELNLQAENDEQTKRLLGILMTGVGHFNTEIHETALTVLCREVLGSKRISLERREKIFLQIHKKLQTILKEPREGELTFFNRAAMMNHLYRYIVEHEVNIGKFEFAKEKPVAFFPGTFDPFSVGHKQIVERILNLGFEVYLAIDEFSWSKNTAPKLLRREITAISVADQWDTYLFPDEIAVNIAIPSSLSQLKTIFGERELYLVCGSDVIQNASAYKKDDPGSAADYNHIVFIRHDDGSGIEREMRRIIRGDIKVFRLPEDYDDVSSTKIRSYIDQGLDISSLVDPVAQNFIYENNLYVRTPEMKGVSSKKDLFFRKYRGEAMELPEVVNQTVRSLEMPLVISLLKHPEMLCGWAIGHTLSQANLYDALHSIEAANYVRKHTSGRILMIDSIHTGASGHRNSEYRRVLLNELLTRSLESDHTYALCKLKEVDNEIEDMLIQLGFLPVPNCEDILFVDMRRPIMLLQDIFLHIKPPYQEMREVREVVRYTRPKLRRAINKMFPGQLLLCFDSEMLNQALTERIETINGVLDAQGKTLGPYMCVPYGKIITDQVIPHTVTKTLHVEKTYSPDCRSFEIAEYPKYSSLRNQARMLSAFDRPFLLVDDLLHKGYRMDKLDKVFREENMSPERIVVAVMSGYGRDLMKIQNRYVESEYFIPNLRYWMTESLLYPFLGGDSISGRSKYEHMIPSINMILPYAYPYFLDDVSYDKVIQYSRTSLENARDILKALERCHQKETSISLSLGRLSEVLLQPRLPDKGNNMQYNFNLYASSYIEEDLAQLQRGGAIV